MTSPSAEPVRGQLSPNSFFGQYRLEEKVGSGGLADVWRATDVSSRTVAIKIFRIRLDAEQTGQLRAELELLAAHALHDNPHVVHVLDGGAEPLPYVVMEFIAGHNLASLLAQRGRLSERETVDVASAISDALQAGQAVGIEHRDVKPANVLLADDGAIKLSDFNTARIVGYLEPSKEPTAYVSLPYAAPETFDGKWDIRSDLYSLGAVLFHCLAGRPPFTGTSAQIVRGHLVDPPDLSVLPPGTDARLRALIDQCLQKSPDLRPGNPREVADRLALIAVELPTERSSAPTVIGPWRISSNHPTQAWAWRAENEQTGEHATVEVLFSADATLGESLRRAVDVNAVLVPLGAERLLGSGRVMVRPGEEWLAGSAASFAFWVARGEVEAKHVELTADTLPSALARLQALLTAAASNRVKLDCSPRSLVLVDGPSPHVRRPGLPFDDGHRDVKTSAVDTLRQLCATNVRPLVVGRDLDEVASALALLDAQTAPAVSADQRSPSQTSTERPQAIRGRAAIAVRQLADARAKHDQARVAAVAAETEFWRTAEREHESSMAADKARLDAELQSNRSDVAASRAAGGRELEALNTEVSTALERVDSARDQLKLAAADASNTPTDHSARSDDWSIASFHRLPPSSLITRVGTLRPSTQGEGFVELAGDAIPAYLSLETNGSFVIQGPDRSANADLLRSIALRVVMGNEPGAVRLTLIDPTGDGQGLASFLRLPAQLRGPKVFARMEEVEAALIDLAAHIEDVLQKRLGGEYESVAAYNAANPTVPVAYRLVTILDVPGGGWSERAWNLLNRIAHNGPRAGVHTIVTFDQGVAAPRGIDLEMLSGQATRIELRDGRGSAVGDLLLGGWQFVPDEPPPPTRFAELVGELANASAAPRVLDYAQVALPVDWSGSSELSIRGPIGIGEDGKPVDAEFGDDPAHALVGGMTGMGKSNLLHVLVTQLCARYSPDELQLYLLDFREGVGFAVYRDLPHARAIALETDREFALSVLRQVRSELVDRGAAFKRASAGEQFAAFRAAGKPMPRLLMIVDEFQLLLAEDDDMAREASGILEDLVKRGRGFGVHVLLSSQSPAIAGAYLARITNQMALRIALRCRPEDAFAILGEGNSAAADLEEPGTAIVNDALGRRDRNQVVRIAHIARGTQTKRVAAIIGLAPTGYRRPITFEGQAPALIEASAGLREAILSGRTAPGEGVDLYLGEPIELKMETTAPIARSARSNLLVAGPDPPAALGILFAATASALAGDASVRVDLIDFARDEAFAQAIAPLEREFGERLRRTSAEDGTAFVEAALTELRRRVTDGERHAPTILVVLSALHRWRALRSVDQFTPSDIAVKILEILDDGPEYGVHIAAWFDGNASIDRTLQRDGHRRFELRAVLRVPETDSQNLLESAAAARLADGRAIFRNEEWPLGKMEKFKPYNLPSPEAVHALWQSGGTT